MLPIKSITKVIKNLGIINKRLIGKTLATSVDGTVGGTEWASGNIKNATTNTNNSIVPITINGKRKPLNMKLHKDEMTSQT